MIVVRYREWERSIFTHLHNSYSYIGNSSTQLSTMFEIYNLLFTMLKRKKISSIKPGQSLAAI